MKFDITLEELDEYLTCIFDCGLSKEEAYEYFVECLSEDREAMIMLVERIKTKML